VPKLGRTCLRASSGVSEAGDWLRRIAESKLGELAAEVTPVLGTGCAGGRPPNWIFEVRIGPPRQMPRSTGAYDQPSKVSTPGVEYRNRLVMLRAKEPRCSRASNQPLSLRHRCGGTALAERRAHA
jgi:hypothetical protein